VPSLKSLYVQNQASLQTTTALYVLFNLRIAARISDHFPQRFDSFRLLQAATRYIDAKSFNGFGGRAATLRRIAREMDRGPSKQ
jgi:hypothetical protein